MHVWNEWYKRCWILCWRIHCDMVDAREDNITPPMCHLGLGCSFVVHKDLCPLLIERLSWLFIIVFISTWLFDDRRRRLIQKPESSTIRRCHSTTAENAAPDFQGPTATAMDSQTRLMIFRAHRYGSNWQPRLTAVHLQQNNMRKNKKKSVKTCLTSMGST